MVLLVASGWGSQETPVRLPRDEENQSETSSAANSLGIHQHVRLEPLGPWNEGCSLKQGIVGKISVGVGIASVEIYRDSEEGEIDSGGIRLALVAYSDDAQLSKSYRSFGPNPLQMGSSLCLEVIVSSRNAAAAIRFERVA